MNVTESKMIDFLLKMMDKLNVLNVEEAEKYFPEEIALEDDYKLWVCADTDTEGIFLLIELLKGENGMCYDIVSTHTIQQNDNERVFDVMHEIVDDIMNYVKTM